MSRSLPPAPTSIRSRPRRAGRPPRRCCAASGQAGQIRAGQCRRGRASAAPPQARFGLPRAARATVIAALLTWIDGIGESGLDGHDLRELGLKDGTLTVDDARTGKRWTFQDITLSLERPHGGGIVVTVGSDNAEHPWGLTASIKPTADGYRSIALEARQFPPSDLLLAARLGDGTLQIDMPLSASLRGEIGPERRAAIADRPDRRRCRFHRATPTVPTAASISTAPNSRSIGMPPAGSWRCRFKFFPAAIGSRCWARSKRRRSRRDRGCSRSAAARSC